MADTTATPPAAKAADPKLLQAHLGNEVYNTAQAAKVHEKAKEAAAKIADATERATAEAAAQKAFDEAAAAAHKAATEKFADAAHQAAYKEFADANRSGYTKALNDVGKLTRAAAHVAEHSGKYAAIAGAVAAGAAMLPNKEVEKPDGTTEKKSSLFKKAVVTVGAVVAIGLAANKLPGAKSWVDKIVGSKLAEKAMGAAR